MEEKAFPLVNQGMNRDLSISKAGESSAWENHNIRILSTDHDTMLSVTNERGNKEIPLGELIQGTLIGWNVLNNHIILFTTENETDADRGGTDRIYRIDYNKGSDQEFNIGFCHEGHLAFDMEHPIESVVYYETENIQKIYWVDGKNVLRFLNFMTDEEGRTAWSDDTYFDSNRSVDFGVSVKISKDNSGNPRANGVAQYFLTYYNKHGQESGYVWISDLVYLSPSDIGGSADGTNTTRVTLEISNLSERFTNFRIYSVIRSAYNGATTAFVVDDGATAGGKAIIVDDGANSVAEDSTRLLYLGSQAVVAGTLEHKDQTLFLGDLQSVGHSYYDAVDDLVKNNLFVDKPFVQDTSWESGCVEFRYSDNSIDEIPDIEYVANDSMYPYKNQLASTSSAITTFKGGEKYRFALVFKTKSGVFTQAFWIGDKVNPLYPVTDEANRCIHRVVAECNLPQAFLDGIAAIDEIDSMQLMIAEASYADRSVKAQGIVNPTMFNVWSRHKNRLYSMPSWIMRARGSEYANMHFQPVANADTFAGEIQCNYWKEGDPDPYYMVDYNDTDIKLYGEFDKSVTTTFAYDYMLLLCGIHYAPKKSGIGRRWAFHSVAVFVTMKENGDPNAVTGFDFTSIDSKDMPIKSDREFDDNPNFKMIIRDSGPVYGKGYGDDSQRDAWNKYYKLISETYELDPEGIVPDWEQFHNWCVGVSTMTRGRDYWHSIISNTNPVSDAYDKREALNFSNMSAERWFDRNTYSRGAQPNYMAANNRKNLMFVDENIVTLNSPEIEYESVSIDNAGLKFRIVGAAKITGSLADYTVTAVHGHLPGQNLMEESFQQLNGSGGNGELLGYPLWREHGLSKTTEKDHEFPSDVDEWTSEEYQWGGSPVRYWLYMWNHSGHINGFTDSDNSTYSDLNEKIFANKRISYSTTFNNYGSNQLEFDTDSVRHFRYTSSQYVGLNVGPKTAFYDGYIDEIVSIPNKLKYPILYSSDSFSADQSEQSNHYLNSTSPISLTFASSAHAVISLHSEIDEDNSRYIQHILPYMFENTEIINSYPEEDSDHSAAHLPWQLDNETEYPDYSYGVVQDKFTLEDDNAIGENDRYLFIGELYYDYDNAQEDSRYGGIREFDIENNKFVTAGPLYPKNTSTIYANQGDTYFQRWDCLKTKPLGADDVNQVIDITSVMLETHINIDGRTDLQRETSNIASIAVEDFGKLNRVYSQPNNFISNMDLDEDFNLDEYRSSITWTMQKADSAEIDEWTRITLGSNLKLDGDKGWCRAIRRFQNSLIAFQDRGISEILFNSRTQLSTTDGVPVEIANSGKVDGKRYITNKYGCINKWSIVEGKNALYFVDNTNKAFCAFTGNVENLSSRLGFDAWFKRRNSTDVWNPASFNNVVSYYDKIHSDVYLVSKDDSDAMGCLAYSEPLQRFSSFYDYSEVPMMTNVEDRFVSFGRRKLWLQHEGLYCIFFGFQYNYWTTYRITPTPYTDKIWTTIDYRTDFYKVLSSDGDMVVNENDLISGDPYDDRDGIYQEDMTYDSFSIWNEYQQTDENDIIRNITSRYPDIRKKFRIWRVNIPRAMRSDTNRFGLDRIRNPWIFVRFKKRMNEYATRCLMQMHDAVIHYFE